MQKFRFLDTEIDGLYIVEPTIFGDHRGYFMETYHQEAFFNAGLDMVFVQENQSRSKKGVLRGLHFQHKYPQGKLVRVVRGEVFDVAVDIRGDSKTFGKWQGIILSEENKRQFYIPEGFAHGFLVLSKEAELVYKCSNYYNYEDESGIIWNDPQININWPLDDIEELILSSKDKGWATLGELVSIL